MPYTKSQLDKMFAGLPDDVKEAMTSVDTVDVLKEIQEKYHFHLDQVADLSAEVGMLMLGAIPPQSFISTVQKSLGVPKETAKEIAATINEKIFKKVRRSLMEIHQMTHEVSGESISIRKTDTLSDPDKNSNETKGEKKTANDPYKETI
jgi:hypothetical protein